MFDILWEEKVITACILFFFALSIMLQGLLSMFYRHLISEAENMATTEHKLLKQCKLKFSNCYQLNGGVSNVPVFVDKFLSRLALGHISLESLYHISGQAMLLSVVGAGVGICKSIIDGRQMLDILPFYILSFVELYLYFSITTVLNVKGRKQTLKISLVDYLENHLSSRMEITEGDMRMLYGDGAKGVRARKRRSRRQVLDFMPITNNAPAVVENQEQEQAPEEAGEEPPKQAQAENIFTGAQEKELEMLLKEFLTS